MAKYRHRIFEMYEFFDECVLALTPKSSNGAKEATTPESWTFESFDVSRSASVIHLQFKLPSVSGKDSVNDLRSDLSQLAEKLSRDSRVLLDFTGVKSFSAGAIDALVQFKKKLRNRGTSIALCCLELDTRESFFPGRAPAVQSDSTNEINGKD